MGLRDLLRRKSRPGETSVAVSPIDASPPPPIDSAPAAQLAEGGTVSVSNEEHYQDALRHAVGAGAFSASVVATLVVNERGNPWTTKPTGAVLEVQLAGTTVGFLTAAMTERFLPLAQSAADTGRPLTAKAWIGPGRGPGREFEITLSALPIWHGQSSIAGLSVETTPEFVRLRRNGRAHLISESAEPGWVTACGQHVTSAQADLVLRTKPFVGRVLMDGTIFHDSPWWCGRCVPNERRDTEAGGRFGAQTDISRAHRSTVASDGEESVLASLRSSIAFDVAGETYRDGYPDNLLRLAEILNGLTGDEWPAAVLRREPSNAFDTKAIEVHVPGSGGHVGYVPADLARVLAPILDRGTVLTASAIEVRIHPDSPEKPGLTIAVSLAPSKDAGR